jgi:hypothetical protein
LVRFEHSPMCCQDQLFELHLCRAFTSMRSGVLARAHVACWQTHRNSKRNSYNDTTTPRFVPAVRPVHRNCSESASLGPK